MKKLFAMVLVLCLILTACSKSLVASSGNGNNEAVPAVLTVGYEPFGGPIIIAIGNALIRQKLQNLVLSSGFELITLIHPTAVIGSDVTISNGSVVMPGAIINAKSTIGNGVIINSGAIIEHECTIGDFAHICPGVAIAGGSLVGERSWIGIGSSIIQNITIKPDITIGAGSVVVKDILEGSLAYGNPCRVVKS